MRVIPSTVSIVLVWLFLLFFCGILVNESRASYATRLGRSSGRIAGRIEEMQPEQHRFIRYSFQIDGRDYTGNGLDEQSLGRSYSSYRVGGSFAIAYNPNNPNESCACDPVKAA